MAKKKLPKEFLKKLKAVKGKRPRKVIDHILEHGHVTTEELRDLYGYGHPPRAARDVRECGIPLERFSVKGKDGRTIAAYRFGDPAKVRGSTHAGRHAFPKKLKQELLERDGCKCALCSATFAPGDLQIDHRVPYEVAGDLPGELNAADYMLVCRTCNRAKSWACEHCKNWQQDKDPAVCQSCFWGSPNSYRHIALRPVRRLNLVWSEEETGDYDALATLSAAEQAELPEYVKDILRRHLGR
jgi:hypothetical protein